MGPKSCWALRGLIWALLSWILKSPVDLIRVRIHTFVIRSPLDDMAVKDEL